MTRIDTIGRGLLLSAFWLLLTACAGQAVRTAPPAPQFGPALQWPKDRFTIHTLPVGSGNCQIALCPAQNRLVVMDCGSSAKGDQGWERATVKSRVDGLLASVASPPDLVITVSHSDSDHYNFLPDVFDDTVLAKTKSKNLWLVGNYYQYSDTFLQWVENSKKSGLGTQYIQQRLSSMAIEPALSCPSSNGAGLDVEARVLAVNAAGCGNDSSLVVSMTYNGNFRTIFTGDMTETTRRLIAHNITDAALLRPTQLITAAHHGSSTDGSNSTAWAGMTLPETVVASAGTLYWHPTCAALTSYRHSVRGGAKPHTISCSAKNQSKNQWYWYPNSTQNTYVTNDNGRISVSAAADGSYAVDTYPAATP